MLGNREGLPGGGGFRAVPEGWLSDGPAWERKARDSEGPRVQ